ncbi:MAG: SH3 domain-containing protein [Mailhella sp.]|nr:SH3 domain-containing protein [Mailhella sp.]
MMLETMFARACRPVLLAAAAASLLLGGCASAPLAVNGPASVEDLRLFPQSLETLAEQHGGPRGADTVLRSHEDARIDMARFRRRFFEPWDSPGVDSEALQGLLDELRRAPERRGYAENMHPWSDEAWSRMAKNADLPRMERLRVLPRMAITVRASDLRSAPTMKPRFSGLHEAGRGWPFDLFQYSRLHAGTPLAVYHKSRDGAWLLVQSSTAWGWVRAEDVAAAGENFRRLWRKTPLCAFVQEGVGLKFKALAGEGKASVRPGSYLASADIGAVLPSPFDGEVLLPMRGLDGEACAVRASFADYAAPSRDSTERYDMLSRPAVRMPLLLTPRAVARIGDRMMGQPYGWGGLYGDRDCSATMQDLFTPFGLWLPRNSSKQAQEGAALKLEGMSAEAKEKALREQAVPFRTLIAMPGHIGLYAGQWQGRAAMFHNMWGVRNTLPGGKAGRLVIGRAVVTGLRPGEERGDVDEGRLLIERVKGFAVLGE